MKGYYNQAARQAIQNDQANITWASVIRVNKKVKNICFCEVNIDWDYCYSTLFSDT